MAFEVYGGYCENCVFVCMSRLFYFVYVGLNAELIWISLEEVQSREIILSRVFRTMHRKLSYAVFESLKDLKFYFFFQNLYAIGRLISVRGTVVRMSVVKPLVTCMDFTCPKCKRVISRQFKDGRFSPPTVCGGSCRSKTFTPERSTAKCIDFQKIRYKSSE